jgi:hypothetical protein
MQERVTLYDALMALGGINDLILVLEKNSLNNPNELVKESSADQDSVESSENFTHLSDGFSNSQNDDIVEEFPIAQDSGESSEDLNYQLDHTIRLAKRYKQLLSSYIVHRQNMISKLGEIINKKLQEKGAKIINDFLNKLLPQNQFFETSPLSTLVPQVNIFLKEQRKLNEDFQSAFQARAAIAELIKNEETFVNTCKNVAKKIEQLKPLIDRFEANNNNNVGLIIDGDTSEQRKVELKKFFLSYDKIMNNFSFSIKGLNFIGKPIFSAIIAFNQKILNGNFFEHFDQLIKITKNCEAVNKYLTLMQRGDFSADEKRFLLSLYQVLIAPTQRMMRYGLTLKEFYKHIKGLMDKNIFNEFDYEYINESTCHITKEVAQQQLEEAIRVVDTLTKGFNEEQYLSAVIKQITANKNELTKEESDALVELTTELKGARDGKVYTDYYTEPVEDSLVETKINEIREKHGDLFTLEEKILFDNLVKEARDRQGGGKEKIKNVEINREEIKSVEKSFWQENKKTLIAAVIIVILAGAVAAITLPPVALIAAGGLIATKLGLAALTQVVLAGALSSAVAGIGLLFTSIKLAYDNREAISNLTNNLFDGLDSMLFTQDDDVQITHRSSDIAAGKRPSDPAGFEKIHSSPISQPGQRSTEIPTDNTDGTSCSGSRACQYSIQSVIIISIYFTKIILY